MTMHSFKKFLTIMTNIILGAVRHLVKRVFQESLFEGNMRKMFSSDLLFT